MRVILLLLLFAVCASGGFRDTKLGQKLEKFVQKIKGRFNATGLLKIREKFYEMTEKIVSKLALSSDQKVVLSELLKQVLRIKNDHVNEKGDSIDEINEKSGIDELLYQGDIALTEVQANEITEDVNGGNRTRRQAGYRDHQYPRTIWQKGVNYYFDSSATNVVRSVFKKGAYLWMKDTCIDFFENPKSPDTIRVFVEDGCWSYVGRTGKVQELSLGVGCETVGTAAHEIGHALGLFHTQSRYDRDNFITLNAQNIKPDWLDQFNRETPERNENYGLPYDYGSIMHYSASSASRNGGLTMVPHNPRYAETLGSPFISFFELLLLNQHYGCTKRCDPAKSAKCKMGGFPHPRDCSRCICPSGYGGKLCSERPPGCGKMLQASPSYQTFEAEIGDRNAGKRPREDMTMCNYWITAPEGSRIEVKITGISKGLALLGCSEWGLEIKTHGDARFTGYRFCAPEDIGTTLVSKFHIVPIIAYNKFYATQFELQYRIVSGGPPKPNPNPNPKPNPNPNCVDKPECPSLIRSKDFCRNKAFSMSIKEALCPRACRFC